MYRILLWFATLLGLAGCMSIPLTSLVALSRIDIGTTDLSVLRVAIRLPGPVRPRAGGVVMDAVQSIRGEPDQKTTFLLIATRDPADLTSLPPEERLGFATYTYRLSGDDLVRFDALRQTVLRRHAEGKSASLGFGIATEAFCSLAPLPAGPVLTTTYLLTSETGRYIVVTDDLDLRSETKISRALDQLDPCGPLEVSRG